MGAGGPGWPLAGLLPSAGGQRLVGRAPPSQGLRTGPSLTPAPGLVFCTLSLKQPQTTVLWRVIYRVFSALWVSFTICSWTRGLGLPGSLL